MPQVVSEIEALQQDAHDCHSDRGHPERPRSATGAFLRAALSNRRRAVTRAIRKRWRYWASTGNSMAGLATLVPASGPER